LIEEHHEQDDGENPNRPVQNLIARDEVDAPNVEQRPKKLDVTHGVSKNREEDIVDVENG